MGRDRPPRAASDPQDSGMNHQMSLLAPYRRSNPQSSVEASERVEPKVRGQLQKVLSAVVWGDFSGMSNREIQHVVCDHNPGDPAWNKIPTRCRTLERMGLLRLVVDADGSPDLRTHPDGGRFLTWVAT